MIPTLCISQLPDGRGVIRCNGWIVAVFPTPDRAERMRRAVLAEAQAQSPSNGDA